MINNRGEFTPDMSPDEGPGGDAEDVEEDSMENVREDLAANDEMLRSAGHLPDPISSERLSPEEIRAKIREKLEEHDRDLVSELPKDDKEKIRDLLTTLKINGADMLSDEEIELIWGNLLRNPSLVKDFIYYLTDRNSKNNYCEFPLLPDAKDLLEFADNLSNPESLRPKIIRNAADNLARIGFPRGNIMEIAMGSHGPQQAEMMQLLGWLASFPFMNGARNELAKYHEEMEIESVTVGSIAHTFIIMVVESLNTIKGRSAHSYGSNYKMDRESYEFTHQPVVRSLEGILNLLDKTFLSSS